MRALVQRVLQAEVKIDGQVTAKIDRGLLVFLGVSPEDGRAEADKLLNKILKMRIFEDEAGKTNNSLAQVGGELLLVSQFTLYADCRKGNRPSFTKAAGGQVSEDLYNYFVEQAKLSPFRVETGSFGADMKINLTNDGPFTIWLDTEDLTR